MVIKLAIGTAVSAAILSSCNYAAADTPCDYVKDVNTTWTHQIEKTENIQRNVFPYVEDTRKCVMSMDVTISGQTYPAEGSYVFGPDMTENNACDNATVNAKKSIISQVSPEVLSATTEMNCSTKELPVHVAAPQPEVNIVERPVVTETIVSSTPVVTERIISSKVIDNTPVRVVQSQNSWIPDLNIGGIVVGVLGNGNIHIQTRKKGACYARWDGTTNHDCY